MFGGLYGVVMVCVNACDGVRSIAPVAVRVVARMVVVVALRWGDCGSVRGDVHRDEVREWCVEGTVTRYVDL